MSGAGQGSFAGSGTIGRYWQTRCRGFEVLSPRGRRLGTVQALELDRETAAAVVLLVRRRGRRGVLRVRPESISLVDPWERRLVVSRRRRRVVSAWPVAAARGWPVAAARGAARGGRSAGLGTVRVARGSGRALPPAGRGALAVGRRAAIAVGFVAWLYAFAVGSVAHGLLRVLLAVAGATRWGVAWAGPRLHGAGARLVGHLAREYERESPGRPPLRT